MKKTSEIIEEIEVNKKNLEFLKTGFNILDQSLDGGFLKKELVILGAFTGIGKSIFAGQLLYQIAKQGFKTAYFSLEISNHMIISRLIGQHANIKPTRIIAGLLEPEEFDKKAKAKAELLAYNDNMEFEDNLYMMGELEKAIKENQYEFVVIDFIQNIQLANNMDEYARLSFLSIQLQKLAKEKNCCIMILSQVSNKVGREGSKIVEYKGSGAIAMVADLGFILKREEAQVIEMGQPVGRQWVVLELLKNRRGIGGLKFNFDFQHPGGMLHEKQ
ncbi:MAG TPA: DnaB-like helicase C-terminal domain-containing protein [Clostridia bacterium]